MKKYKLTISGMHCASCAGNIERSIKKISGVQSCNVSLLMKKGTVECDDKVSEDELKKAVARAGGYKVVNVEKV